MIVAELLSLLGAAVLTLLAVVALVHAVRDYMNSVPGSVALAVVALLLAAFSVGVAILVVRSVKDMAAKEKDDCEQQACSTGRPRLVAGACLCVTEPIPATPTSAQ